MVSARDARALVFGGVVFVSDPRADPVGLLGPLEAAVTKPCHEFSPAGVGEHRRPDRGPSRRAFVNGREIDAAVKRECQRPRDRGCGHDELVRLESVAASAVEGLALHDAKAVLLVHDHKSERAEMESAVKESMSADSETGVAGGDLGFVHTPLSGRDGAPESKHGDAERGQLSRKTIVVLTGQNLGGGEQGHLFSGFQGVKGSQDGDECLPAADIALEDPDHGLCPPQIGADFLKRPLLPLGWAPRQLCQVAVDEMAGANESWGRSIVEAAAPKTCPQDVSGQLLCGESSSGLFQNVLDVVFGGWSVEDTERLGQGRDIEP
jgi:hypothetical protein